MGLFQFIPGGSRRCSGSIDHPYERKVGVPSMGFRLISYRSMLMPPSISIASALERAALLMAVAGNGSARRADAKSPRNNLGLL